MSFAENFLRKFFFTKHVWVITSDFLFDSAEMTHISVILTFTSFQPRDLRVESFRIIELYGEVLAGGG